MGETLKSNGCTRRNFIKGAAALAATGALMANVPLAVAEEPAATCPDQLFGGYCACNCGGGCYLNVHVRDGQVVRTSARDLPNTEFNRICSKGATHVGRLYTSKRVLYPMKRIGERGAGEFERITWEEAISTICENWKAATDKYGPQGFGILNGSGNYSLANGTCNGISGYQLLQNITGASCLALNVDAGMGFGTSRAHGGVKTVNGILDRKNAKVQVMWGCNPPNALPQTMHFFMEAKEQGTKLIVIDPLYDTMASKADWWIPVKAGTDGALALGCLNVLLTNGWVPEERLRDVTNAPFLVKEDGSFLRMSDLGVAPAEGETSPIALWCANSGKAVPFDKAGNPAITGITEVEGIKVQTVYDQVMANIAQYTPEVAAEICGLTPEDVVELARVYAFDGPVSTEQALGFNHYQNTHYATWAQALVVMLTGNYGKAGASYGMTEEYLIQLMFPNYGALYPTDSKGNPCQGPGRTIIDPQILQTIQNESFAGDGIGLGGAYIHGSNPASTFAEHSYTESWLKAIDFLVCADMYMSETMKYADIILPSAHWFEKEDLGFLFATHPYVCWNEQAVEPAGEAKSDFEIFGMIAEGLGYGDYWPASAREFIDNVLNSDTFKALGINVENMIANGAMSLYPGNEDYVTEVPATGLETGRIYLQHEKPAIGYNVGQDIDVSKELTLQFVEGTYMGEHSENRAKHPFHVIGEKMRTHTHTQWSEVDYVKEYEPEPIARFNPDDAAELGIQENDYVKLYNDNGYVVMKAVLNAGVPPKTITSGRSWNAEDFVDGHFASLCNIDFNQVCANQAFNDCAVSVEKA